MDRATTARIVLTVALAAAACGKKTSPGEAPNPGSASAGSALTNAANSGSAVRVAAAPLVPGALDAALEAKTIAATDVKQRAETAHSAWAVVAGKKTTADAPTELDVIRVRADGIADVRLMPPSSTEPSSFGDIISLEARDLDKDGLEEAVLLVAWHRTTKVKSACKGCWVSTDEEAKQLYVLTGAGAAVAPAFTHLVSYETTSEGYPEDNATPYASPEQVAYEWKIVDGTPAVVKLTRTKHEVAKEDRLQGVLDPSADPLFAAGAGKDVPLVLE